jgi:hypothetical protein
MRWQNVALIVTETSRLAAGDSIPEKNGKISGRE